MMIPLKNWFGEDRDWPKMVVAKVPSSMIARRPMGLGRP